MSHIFLQKDNITILGDVYDYPQYKILEDDKVKETITVKTLFLQIIITVNGKQKVYRVNYDLMFIGSECYKGVETKEHYEIENGVAFMYLFDFIEALGYDLSDFDIEKCIEIAVDDE